MNLIDIMQKEITRFQSKPRGVKVIPTQSQTTRVDGHHKPGRQLSKEINWMVQSYSYDRGGSYNPVIEDFITQIYPAPQQNDDGFNTINCWSIQSKNGTIRDRQLPQYTNRRYSTYIITEKDIGREPVKLTIRWNKDWRILHTNPEGVEISYTTNTEDREYTIIVPISSGCNRIDVLLYTDDTDASELSIHLDTTDMYSNALPIPMMRMATIDNIILANGDGAWHDHRSATTYNPAGATITFQDNSESTTVNFVDNSTIPSDDQIVRTGAWSEFSNGDTIVVSGSVSNDGVYTAATVAGDTITLASGNKLQDEPGVAVSIRTKAEITDSASGLGIFNAGDVIRVSNTTSNNKTLIADAVIAGKITLDIHSTVTDEATVQANITTLGDTHHGLDEGVNFRVRDVMLIPQVIEVLPNDILTYNSAGHEHQTLDLEITDPALTGDTDAGTAHQHGSTGLSVTGDTGAGTTHDHPITGVGDHDHSAEVTADGSHDHGGTTGSESSHAHPSGTLDVGGSTDTEFAHTHGLTSPTAEITDPVIIGGTKTGKDTITIPGSQVVDETDSELVSVEIMRNGNNFVLPAVRAFLSKSLVFNQIEYTAAGIQYKDVVNEANTIVFNNNSPANDTITDSGAGFGDFQNGMEITVVGSLYNDGTFTVQTAAAGTLTLTGIGVLTDESTGYSCSVGGESYIYKAGANFDTQGFVADTLCRVSNTTNNDGEYSIKSVTATKLNLYSFETLVNETIAGNSTIKGCPTITDAGNEFITSGFVDDMTISISGAANPANNGNHYIETATAGKLTLSIEDILVGETVSSVITSVDCDGFRVRYRIASGKKYRIHYVCLAYGISCDPYSPSYP